MELITRRKTDIVCENANFVRNFRVFMRKTGYQSCPVHKRRPAAGNDPDTAGVFCGLTGDDRDLGTAQRFGHDDLLFDLFFQISF